MKNKATGRRSDLGSTAVNAISDAVGRGSVSFFDSKSGTVILTALALVLWWIPYLGQIIPAYVGGRRAGSVGRSIMVVSASAVILVAASATISGGITYAFSQYAGSVVQMRESYPALVGGMETLSSYLATIATVTDSRLVFDTQKFFLLFAFAFVGGIMADQARKETRIIVNYALRSATSELPRSVKAYNEKRPSEFDSFSDYTSINVGAVPASDVRREKKETVAEAPALVTSKLRVSDATSVEVKANFTERLEPVSTTVVGAPHKLESAVATSSETVTNPTEESEEPATPKRKAVDSFDYL